MSIQDDYFDLLDHLNKKGPQWAREAFARIWAWGCENENETERLRPIVGKMRSAISGMFDTDKPEE